MKKPFNNFHNEQTLKLDVKQQQPNKIPRFVQYDSALLKIELYDNGKLYDVSRADEFVVSFKRPDGKYVSGLASYDGEFINYKMSKQDLEVLGEVEARLQVYEGRNRLSSLNFRYDVYEDYESVGDINDVTLLSALLSQVRDALNEAQRQGGYAENRGDFANAAGDYANKAGDSQKMRWLKWVKTVEERNSTYRNPRNGDTLYVVNVADKSGGAVYRYNSMERPAKWEEISGWDTSIIQDIYNLIDTKEDKTKVAQLVDNLQKELENMRFGAHNIIQQTDTSVSTNDSLYSPITSNSEVSMVGTSEHGRVVQARLPANTNQSYFGASVGNSNGKRVSVKEGETLTLSFIGAKSLTATDFTYVYLMRPNSEGSNKSMTLKLKHDIDSSGYDKYEFNVTAPWSSDNAYILIGANKNPAYGNDSAFWIRFKDVMLVRGNRATDWAVSLEDLVSNYKDLIKIEKDRVNGELTKHNSRIEQLENKITMTVTETKYDSKMREIAKWQSKYEQTARDITTTVSKKVGADEIVSRINQSAEKISIDAKKISLGGDVVIENGLAKIKHLDLNKATVTGEGGGSKDYIRLNKDKLISHGRFTRTWAGETDTAELNLGINKGRVMISNEDSGYNLYMTERGLSTTMAGAISDYSAGTIEFHSQRYNTTSRGVTVHSTYGTVALESDYSTIYTVSDLTTNIESKSYSIYFRPYRDTRGGLNEFRMWVKNNPSASATDGVLSYGNLTSVGDYGAGIRFSKERGKNTIYATNPNGDIGTGNFQADSFIGDLVAPASYVYAVGERLRVIKNQANRSSYAELQAGDTLVDSIRTNDGSTNFYIGVSTNELRVTNNLMWNGGSPGYRPVRASKFIEGSSEKFKSNIEKWETSVLDEFRNGVQLYSYNLNSDLESGRAQTRHGVVIERETPEAWINGDGIMNYEITAWTVKGIQELIHEHDKLKSEVETMRQEMAELKRLILEA